MSSKQLLAIGLILVGLGVPGLVDAVETAYHLDIPRDLGVLPWYIVIALGVVLFVWQGLRSDRSAAAPRSTLRGVLWALACGLAVVVVAFVGVLLLGRNVVEQILASGDTNVRLAVRGLVLVAGGVGVLVSSATFVGR